MKLTNLPILKFKKSILHLEKEKFGTVKSKMYECKTLSTVSRFVYDVDSKTIGTLGKRKI